MDDLADNTDLKERFALNLLLRHGDAREAASDTAPGNYSYAHFIAQNWLNDLYVLACKQQLIERYGAAFFLPSRYDTAHKIIQVAERSLVTEDKLKALKLYAELMGFVEKPGVVVNNNNNVTHSANKVMIFRDHGTDAEWEAKAVRSQALLIADAQ